MTALTFPAAAVAIEPPSIPTARFYKPELDALRLTAFLMVFVHHVLPHDELLYRSVSPIWARLGTVLGNTGGFGLSLFLFLSGYLITTLLTVEAERCGAIDLKAFYLRRTLRIGPLYLLGVAIGMLWSALANDGAELRMFASYLTLTGNWWFQYNSWSENPMSLLWSIALEEQFYLFFPVTLLLLGRTKTPWIGAALVGVSLLHLFVRGALHDDIDRRIWTSTFSQTLFLGAGVVFACLLRGRTVQLAGPARLALGVTAAALMAASAAATDAKHFGPATSGLSVMLGYAMVAVACGAAMLAVADLPVAIPRLILLGGRASFGLYVFHGLALATARAILGVASPLVPALGLAIACAAAWLSYLLIEQPALRLRRRFSPIATGQLVTAYAHPSST